MLILMKHTKSTQLFVFSVHICIQVKRSTTFLHLQWLVIFLEKHIQMKLIIKVSRSFRVVYKVVD